MAEPLACRWCATRHPGDERFCPECGMPLTFAPGSAAVNPKPDERRDRARKVKPAYRDGPLVRVAWARHQAEAELLQGILLEEGIPSLLRRTGGFDVPDFLAAGPRDVLVPEAGARAAREALGLPADGPPPAPALRPPAAPWVRALAAALAVLLLAVLAAGVLSALG